MTNRAVHRLTGVYQANGTLLGELAYVVGKVFGRAHCGLCDITHGHVQQKASFRVCRAALPVPFDTVHLDERSPEVLAFTEGKTPCVVAHTEEGLELLLDAAALDACEGEVERFRAALDAALDARHLVLTPAGT